MENSDYNQNECPICLDNYKYAKKVLISCGHSLCYTCFIKISKYVDAKVICHMCRKEYTAHDTSIDEINYDNLLVMKIKNKYYGILSRAFVNRNWTYDEVLKKISCDLGYSEHVNFVLTYCGKRIHGNGQLSNINGLYNGVEFNIFFSTGTQ